MFCQKCGSENNNDAKFCLRCGNQFNETKLVNQNEVINTKEKKKKIILTVILILMIILLARLAISCNPPSMRPY